MEVNIESQNAIFNLFHLIHYNQQKGNKKLRFPVLDDHEFLQSKDFLEKPIPTTFQMRSRLSLEIKNKNIHVLDCEKSNVQYALYYLTLLILK